MGIFTNEPQFDVHAAASFPESNPFGLIVNGEQNQLLISVANSGSKNYTLLSASASYHDVNNNWALIKNASTTKYGIPLVTGTNFSVPFQVYSEFRPREIGLTVWVNMADPTDKTVVPVTAFNSTASVVEPASSIFDPQLIFMYLILTAALAGGAYWAYNTFFAPSTTRKGGRAARSSASSTSGEKKKAVVAADQAQHAYPDVKPYEEEWIPTHHLKSKGSKLRKREGTGAGGASSAGEDGITSGGEATSGGEMSGPEGPARGKKGKGKRA